ncbi:acyl-CoA thioesterase [Halomonas sp. DQ26W]|uniref:acyl-CoA thioesterase n=1 Tax=Halomonas sp. DQ26W TaxID=2282311 RepID=UPI000DF74DD3|nr:thioesterase family protein [Halomonas sp. DQ26W]RDB43268.1 acyl-CoA thioesterase [Halomonas sp. DQ26W]
MSQTENPLDPQTLTLDDFPVHDFDKLRYADTDRQGHVNNAIFSTFLESGRVNVIYNPDAPLVEEGTAFVIARLELNFHREVNWPGQVEIGTRVTRVGRSSLTLQQGVFQDLRCVATANTVIVQVDESTRRSHPFGDRAQATLEKLVAPARLA